MQWPPLPVAAAKLPQQAQLLQRVLWPELKEQLLRLVEAQHLPL